MSQKESSQGIHLSATNVGGIDNTEVEFDSGVTVLEGRNATNRTSLLQALMAVLGSEDVSLKADADEGSVELALDGHRYTRTLERKNGTIVTGGDPYLEDTELADLFAFLVESNEARRAVTRGDDLHDLIMRPVDTEAIQREIRQLKGERQEIDDELDELDSLKGELPRLERERTRLESEIETKREELEQKNQELDAADTDVDETREEKAELEDKLEELRETRSTLEDVRFDIETETESLDALRDEQAELQTELDELAETPTEDVEELQTQMSKLRERKQGLDAELNELQSTIQFNEEMLDDAASSTYGSWLDESDSTGSVTDQLVASNEQITCWTCGSEVQRDQIAATLDQLRDRRQEKLDESKTIQQELEEFADEKDRLEAQQQQRADVDSRLDRISDEIEERTDDLEALRSRRDGLTEEIRDLEADIDALEDQEYSEILDLHKEANELEFELGRLESELDDVDSEIEAIENRLTEQDRLEERRADVQAELEELRTRIGQIERQAVEQFNEHMEAILDILDYTNLERIWIERTKAEVRRSRKQTTQTNFELHIVRRSESGATYEDTVDHLSESERETTGLIFALAGYLVHDVHETVPFMLLDSLEAIDSERIAALIEYFGEYAEYLVVALLSEDASAVDVDANRITSI